MKAPAAFAVLTGTLLLIALPLVTWATPPDPFTNAVGLLLAAGAAPLVAYLLVYRGWIERLGLHVEQ